MIVNDDVDCVLFSVHCLVSFPFLLFKYYVVFWPGIAGGGAWGIREGFAKAPNRRPRVLMNSVMNSAGKKGSMYGNTLAVLGESSRGTGSRGWGRGRTGSREGGQENLTIIVKQDGGMLSIFKLLEY